MHLIFQHQTHETIPKLEGKVQIRKADDWRGSKASKTVLEEKSNGKLSLTLEELRENIESEWFW